MYARFLHLVAASPHKTPQQVDQIAQGRVWDGGTARQIGLIDGFGGMNEAIAKAAQLAKLAATNAGFAISNRRQASAMSCSALWLRENSDDTAVPSDAFAMLH